MANQKLTLAKVLASLPSKNVVEFSSKPIAPLSMNALKKAETFFEKKRKRSEEALEKKAKKLRNSEPKIHKELKYLDCYGEENTIDEGADTSGWEAPPDNGCVGCINAPSVGTGPQQRKGRRIRITSVYLTGHLSSEGFNSDNVEDEPSVYVALVLNKHVNRVAGFNTQNVYEVPFELSRSLTARPFRNLGHTERYDVLDHKTFDLRWTSQSTFIVNNTSSIADVFWQTRVKPVTFQLSYHKPIDVLFDNGTAANVDNVLKNAIHVVAKKNTTASSVTFRYISRVRFYDYLG